MIKVTTLLTISFYAMAVIIFSNINGLIFSLYGITAPFSVLILAACLLISYYLYDNSNITLPHYCLNLTYASYFIIGGIMLFFLGHLHHEDLSHYHVLRKQLPAVLLLYAFYKYAIYEGKKRGLSNLLFFIGIFTFLITMTIPFGEVIGLKQYNIYNSSARESGVFINPNKAGEHINYTLALVLFLTVNSKRWSWLFVALLPLVLYSTFLTFSKAAIISALTLVLFFLFINMRGFRKLGRSRRRKLSVLLVLIIGTIIYATPTILEVIDNLNYQQLQRLTQIQGLLQGQIDTQTTTQRSDLWAEGFEIISRYPITGFGFASFNELPRGGLGVHNTYLMVWGEGGFFAFAFFMAFVITIYYRAFFWMHDPGYQFLAISLCIIITIQVYMASVSGIRTSETVAMTGILLAILRLMKGRVVVAVSPKRERRLRAARQKSNQKSLPIQPT